MENSTATLLKLYKYCGPFSVFQDDLIVHKWRNVNIKQSAYKMSESTQ
jgi:hypothetical protein